MAHEPGLKCHYNESSDLLLLHTNNKTNVDQEYFDRICDTYLECHTDVKAKINDFIKKDSKCYHEDLVTLMLKAILSVLSRQAW